ncbi:hypothetical protein JYT57_00835 [Nitrosarchaeum koreense]|nr:hypothetical protein [Nitrosarchaeum koreense]
MIKTIQKKLIISSALIVLLATFFGMTQPQIFADETDEKQYIKANDIAIRTVFGFGDVIEESDGFQVYTQISGFDRSLGTPTFKLKGVMGFDRAYLYEAVDMTSKRGISNTQQKYGQFTVDVYLHKDDITLRHFKYTDCTVSDYRVTTLFDKEEGWTTSKGFATIDEFEFECSGYKSNNPLYVMMKKNGYKSDTVSSLDLKDTKTWSELYK